MINRLGQNVVVHNIRILFNKLKTLKVARSKGADVNGDEGGNDDGDEGAHWATAK